MRGITFVLAVCLAGPFATLSAQQPPPLEAGERVRVWASDFDLEGQLGFVHTDSVLVNRGGRSDRLAISLSSVTKLERRELKSSATGGALVGFLVGLVAGSVTGTFVGLTGHECESDVATSRCTNDSNSVSDAIGLTGGAWGSVVGGVLGTAFGALIGASIKTDRWEEVPLDRLRVSFAPQRDARFALGFSVSF